MMPAARTVILLWLVVALAWLGVPTPALAGPTSATPPSTSTAPPATDSAPKDVVPPSDAATETPQDAVATGDLTTQREQAAAATRADPSPANHHREGQLAEQAGDHQAALASYQAELGATRDAAARKSVQADISRVRETMRGRVPDEPASTHRKELDARWGAPKKDAVTKPSLAVPTDTGPQPRDRIVRKWYFWVAIVAIAASVGAVTGIAIKASRDDKPDALDRRGVFGIATPALRF